MSATLTICPHCFASRLTIPGAAPDRCPHCRKETTRQGDKETRRQGDGKQERRVVLSAGRRVEGLASARAGTQVDGRPEQLGIAGTALRRPRRQGRGLPAGVIAVAVAVALVGGGLALGVLLSGSEPPPAIHRTVRSAGAVAAVPAPATPAAPAPAAAVPPPRRENEAPIQIVRKAIYQTDAPSESAHRNRIDELVFARLKEEGITPAAPCSDAVFVRRVYLDVIGTLPTAREARAFLADTNPKKRQVLIDHLLDRQEFADYWAMKWGDLLRVKSEFPINLWPNGAQAYDRWIRASLRENLPYDRFVRALLTSSGSNFRVPPANFYRAVQGKEPKTIAYAVGLTFMGVRPEAWPSERWAGLAAFFAQVGYKATGEWKEEIVYFDPRKPLNPAEAVFPDGSSAAILPDQDPRVVFADWLITPRNPWFTRNIANRVWAWLVGRGIIHEPDDIRPDNPPSHPELLAYLEQELIAAHYDLKQLYRLILNSNTYQLSSLSASQHPEAAAQFASYPIRRVEAEVLLDAICRITGTTEKYYSPIPEPFTYIPEEHRSISLPDGSITSAFLEMFGRPPRDTGLEAERNNNFTAAQRLHLLNSSHILGKLEQGPGLAALRESRAKPREIAEELYLTILSRYPSAEELDVMATHAQAGTWGRRPLVDLAWALINSAEFLCRH